MTHTDLAPVRAELISQAARKWGAFGPLKLAAVARKHYACAFNALTPDQLEALGRWMERIKR